MTNPTEAACADLVISCFTPEAVRVDSRPIADTYAAGTTDDADAPLGARLRRAGCVAHVVVSRVQMCTTDMPLQ